MKIALLAPLRFPVSQPFHGGVEMHTYLLATELAKRGHELTLFAHPDSDAGCALVPVSLPASAGFGQTTFAYRRVMRRVAGGGFDLVHDNSLHFLPPLLAGSLPCPMVTTLHTPPYRSFRLTAGLTRRARGHHYVSISKFLGERWSRLIRGYDVVHNGISLEQWPLSRSPEPGTAVWYGRFTPEKGAEYAIAAARQAGYQLSLAGPVYDRDYFTNTIQPLLGQDVVYRGHLTQPELAALVGRSAVGLVTSVWEEPFGLVYAEMAACGTPVAAFAGGAVAEIINEDCGIIVPKRDSAALARVLGELESKDRAACRRHIEANFPLRRMVEGYLDVYRRAVEGR